MRPKAESRPPLLAVLLLLGPLLLIVGTLIGRSLDFLQFGTGAAPGREPKARHQEAENTERPAAPRALSPAPNQPGETARAVPAPAAVPEAKRIAAENAKEKLIDEVLAEPLDVNWADSTELAIREKLAPLLDNSAITSLTCRTKRCVVKLAPVDQLTFMKMSPLLVNVEGLERGRIYNNNLPDGTVAVSAVLARNGTLVGGQPDTSSAVN